MNERQNNALDFLLYSYCSISFDDLNELNSKEVLGYLVDRAYKDAASHVLSVEPKRDSDPKKTAREALIMRINILSDTSQSYDLWHHELCERICEIYRDNSNKTSMSYGIAQKWVNMTMKNLMVVYDVACLTDASNFTFVEKYGPLIEQYREQFHVPVDSYIIDRSWSLDDNSVDLPLKDDKTKRIKKYATPSSYVKPWSQWKDNDNKEEGEKNEYQRFQESLRKALAEVPIDWEGPAWIEQAKKRNRKTDLEKE